AHFYRYYRRVYAPKVDVRVVIVATITLISVYQYFAYDSRYKVIDHTVWRLSACANPLCTLHQPGGNRLLRDGAQVPDEGEGHRHGGRDLANGSRHQNQTETSCSRRRRRRRQAQTERGTETGGGGS